MPHNDDDDVKALVQMLSRYLRDHPQASDTPDGITSWWLGLDWYVYEDAIGAALAWLVDAGLIEGAEGPDGRIRYRRVQSAEADEALAALAQPGHAPDAASNGGMPPNQ